MKVPLILILSWSIIWWRLFYFTFLVIYTRKHNYSSNVDFFILYRIKVAPHINVLCNRNKTSLFYLQFQKLTLALNIIDKVLFSQKNFKSCFGCKQCMFVLKLWIYDVMYNDICAKNIIDPFCIVSLKCSKSSLWYFEKY